MYTNQTSRFYYYYVSTRLSSLSYHNYHRIDLKRPNRLKVGRVKMQSVSDDDVWKRLLEKPRSFELAVKGVFRLGRCYIFWHGVPGL